MGKRRNERAKIRRPCLSGHTPLLVAAILISAAVLGWTSGRAFRAATAFTVAQSTVTFDFDTGSPPLVEGMSTPLDQTSEWLGAHFTSPSDPAAFSVQSYDTTFFVLPRFSGKYLYDNNPSRDYMDIQFSQPLIIINFTFATLEYHGGPSGQPSNITLTAYMDSFGNPPVGSAVARGTWPQGETWPQGTLLFDSGGEPFNLVRIVAPYQGPNGATDFLVDWVIVTTAGPIVDITPPVTTISLSGVLGNQGWYKSDVTVGLSATDDMSGVNRIEYSFDNVVWTVYAAPFTVTTEGTTTVYYKSTDNAGNVETVKTQAVKIDKTLPTGSIVINDGAASTNSRSVTLTLTQNDPVSGAWKVRYSNDGVWDTEQWETPSTTKAWTLTAGNGTKTVYYKIKDNAGWDSLTYQDSIVLEETPSMVHDVAVTVVSSAKTVVGQGFCAWINITVQNQGDFSETFDITAYADLSLPAGDEITIQSQTVVNLLIGESRNLSLMWDTSLTPQGSYSISGYAAVLDDIDTADNTNTGGTLMVARPCDVAGSTTTPPAPPDGRVDYKDVFWLLKAYGSDPSKPNWNPNLDFAGSTATPPAPPDSRVSYVDVFWLLKAVRSTPPLGWSLNLDLAGGGIMTPAPPDNKVDDVDVFWMHVNFQKTSP